MMTFEKSHQSFLRVEISDNENVNQKFLRPYNPSMPAKIMIGNEGYKRFRNITVHTKVGFRLATVIYILVLWSINSN